MATHIIIDGYNLIRQSAELSILDAVDLQAGRDALIERLLAYRRHRRHKITVVFDGRQGSSYQEQRQSIKGIAVVFSPIGVEADELIKRLARNGREQCVVVSSDRALVDYARSQQATVMLANEFEQKLNFAVYSMQKGLAAEEADEGSGRGKKMKGPARRLAKKDRRGRVKINKL